MICTTANCFDDTTSILYVSSRVNSSARAATNSGELELLADYDFEHGIANDEEDNWITEQSNNNEQLARSSMVYAGALVEQMIIRRMKQKQKNTCQKCISVFTENELEEDEFIEFKSKIHKNIAAPCKSTLKIMSYVDSMLDRYASLDVSLESIVTKALQSLNIEQFYEASVFNEKHDHRHELIKEVITVHLNIKSRNSAKLLTRLTQEKLIRHNHKKEVHRAGQ